MAPFMPGFEVRQPLQICWEKERPYCYPPSVLIRPIIRHLVPKFPQFMLVINAFKSSSSEVAYARQHFDFYIKIGDYQSPGVITPCKRQWTAMVHEPYFRFYREASSSYIFFKGYSYHLLTEFQNKLQNNTYLRGKPHEKAAVRFLQNLRWSGRQLYEILE